MKQNSSSSKSRQAALSALVGQFKCFVFSDWLNLKKKLFAENALNRLVNHSYLIILFMFFPSWHLGFVLNKICITNFHRPPLLIIYLHNNYPATVLYGKINKACPIQASVVLSNFLNKMFLPWQPRKMKKVTNTYNKWKIRSNDEFQTAGVDTSKSFSSGRQLVCSCLSIRI